MIAGFPICNILNLIILFNNYLMYSNMEHNINGNPTAVQKEKNDDLCNLHSCWSGTAVGQCGFTGSQQIRRAL